MLQILRFPHIFYKISVNTIFSTNPIKLQRAGFHSILKSKEAPLCISKINPVNINRNGRRTFMNIFRKRSQKDYKVIDNLPDEYHLIYRNGMSSYIFGAQAIIAFSTIAIIIVFSLNRDYANYNIKFEEWSNAQKQINNENVVYISAFFILIVLIQIMISRSPLRIYKAPNRPNYTLICPGSYPFAIKRFEFQPGQLMKVEASGVLPWKDNRYKIVDRFNEYRIILIDYYFRRPADFYIMLGEQKDPELEK